MKSLLKFYYTKYYAGISHIKKSDCYHKDGGVNALPQRNSLALEDLFITLISISEDFLPEVREIGDDF